MAQTGYTPIQLYLSTTASAVPTAGNLANGELAINITDGKLFYKDNGGVVQVLATAAGSAGDVVGPGSSTDNALVRFDGTTGKLVQNSAGVLDDSGNLTGLASLTATTLTGALTGTVGATTPNTGAFTTLAASGAVTLSGGTANGIPYLNGSKVLTSGSALTFDGTNLTVGGSAIEKITTNGNIVGTAGQTYVYSNGGSGSAVNAGFLLSGTDNTVRFYAANAEQARLTSSGFGVGQSNPTAKLQIKGGTTIANLGDWNSKSNSMFELANPAVRFGIGYDSSDQVLLQAFDSSNNARLLALQAYGGNVGIGSNAVPSVGSTVVLGVGGANGGTLAVLQSGNIVYRTSASTSGVDFYNPNSSPMQWYTAGVNQMVLTASGNLGVGTTSPAFKIQTTSTTASNFVSVVSVNTGTAGLLLGDTDSATVGRVEYENTNNTMAFYTNGSERARIDSSGNLLVGTTSAGVGTATGFRVVGVASSADRAELGSTASTNAGIGWSMYSTGAGAYRFYVGYGGTIYATSTTITGISDQRLKENIRDLEDGLEKVMALQPRKFDWKNGKGKGIANDRGFIAQEFEQVFPDMIEQWQDPAPEGEEPYKAVNANLIPTLVKAIQEQQAIIEQLKADVAALKGA